MMLIILATILYLSELIALDHFSMQLPAFINSSSYLISSSKSFISLAIDDDTDGTKLSSLMIFYLSSLLCLLLLSNLLFYLSNLVLNLSNLLFYLLSSSLTILSLLCIIVAFKILPVLFLYDSIYSYLHCSQAFSSKFISVNLNLSPYSRCFSI